MSKCKTRQREGQVANAVKAEIQAYKESYWMMLRELKVV